MTPATAVVKTPTAVADATKTWRKTIVAVDPTKNKGYALVGHWMTAGNHYRMPVGALVVGYDRTPDRHIVTAWTVGDDGALTEKRTITRTGPTWAGPATIKALAKLAAAHPWPPLGECVRVTVRPPQRNLHPASCVDCGTLLAAEEGILIQALGTTASVRKSWIVRCETPCQPTPAASEALP